MDDMYCLIYHDAQNDDVAIMENPREAVIGFRKSIYTVPAGQVALFLEQLRYTRCNACWSAAAAVVIDTPFSGVQLLLNHAELCRLLQLLEAVAIRLKETGTANCRCYVSASGLRWGPHPTRR